MEAVRLHAYDQRPVVEEVPDPTIGHPLDVIVRVGGAGLCRTDVHIVEGQWAERTGVALPYTLGHENAGWVEEVGPGVTHVAPGDPVILHPLVTCGLCRACRAGDDMHCASGRFPGLDSDGGMAGYVATGARAVVKLDPSLEPADVAALADAGLTAYHAVKKAVPRLYPGTRVVVIGAGGLGHIGIQSLVALTAAEIIVVDRSDAALEVARTSGAHHTVLADGDQVAAVLELTDGQGAEVVLDFVGESGAEADAWRMTRRAGAHFVVGYGADGRIQLPTIDVISSERDIIGNLVGTYNDLVELMALAAQGAVTVRTQTYPLASVNEAIDDLEAGRLHGRGILVP
jgi:NAD+-dependent secondary alcohol dehydrogenase Adh1